MAFDKKEVETPTSIGRLEITLRRDVDGSKSGEYRLQIIDQNGSVMSIREGNLVAESAIPSSTKQSLSTIIDSLYTLADEKIIKGN